MKDMEQAESWFPKNKALGKIVNGFIRKVRIVEDGKKKKYLVDIYTEKFGDNALSLRNSQWNYLARKCENVTANAIDMPIAIKTENYDEKTFTCLIALKGDTNFY